jgi:hypothetical protein
VSQQHKKSPKTKPHTSKFQLVPEPTLSQTPKDKPKKHNSYFFLLKQNKQSLRNLRKRKKKQNPSKIEQENHSYQRLFFKDQIFMKIQDKCKIGVYSHSVIT